MGQKGKMVENQNRMGKMRRDETTAKTGAVAACHALRAASPLRFRSFSAGQLLRAVQGAARAALPAGIRHAMQSAPHPWCTFCVVSQKCTKSAPLRWCTFGAVSQKVHQKCTATLVHFWCCFTKSAPKVYHHAGALLVLFHIKCTKSAPPLHLPQN